MHTANRSGRLPGLDFLRGIAILLVVYFHSNFSDNLVKQFGWLGVDLFFVLSGFLISGLIFKEIIETGRFRGVRFLIRRGFKIYPSFYFFLVVALGVNYLILHKHAGMREVLHEVFFLQSYMHSVFYHTWSLAVEEHFYFVFAVVALLLNRKVLENRFVVVTGLLLLLIISFCLRYTYAGWHKTDTVYIFSQTHLRSDGIIVGILASYLFYFTPVMQFVERYFKVIVILAILLLVPGFIFPGGSFVMNTIGLSAVNLGFGIFLLLLLNTDRLNKMFSAKINAWIGFIGIHSYTIYLCHFLVKDLVFFNIPSNMLGNIVYVLLAIMIGVLFSFIIEKPFLSLRNKWFR